jgi:small-conductance mechanosensitive channel/CRP-like cAMP-binding protein
VDSAAGSLPVALLHTDAQSHIFWTLGFLAIILAATVAVRNHLARRRLLFAATLLVSAAGAHLAALLLPGARLLQEQGLPAENLLVSCGVITAVVTLLLNPWRQAREDRGTPAIVQDTVIAVLSVVAAVLVFQNSSFVLGVTGSAIVVGLALQDTLGNAFAGLAIQIDKPFKVGHWITAASFEGRVIEVTWRATKIRTPSGNVAVLPNSIVAKEAINNFSEPASPARLSLQVGGSYLTPPNDTREGILAAIGRVGAVLAHPKPEVLFVNFGDSALIFEARFWIDGRPAATVDGYSTFNPILDRAESVKSEVRTAIFYEFQRRGLEIPWPIQIEYQRNDEPRDTPEIRAGFARDIAKVPVLSGLGEAAIAALAQSATERLFADHEVIVREGDAGGSMFVVRRGAVVITVEPDQRQVAVTEAGGYFGEMSLLTGQSRSATVTARGDTRVLEISAADFRAYVLSHPEVIDQIASSATVRQRELDETRALAGAAAPAERLTLSARMRRFFGL